MDNLEQQLSAVMNNPAMMQQIMQLAQNMQSDAAPQPTEEVKSNAFPEFDMSMFQKLSGFAKRSNIDQHQQALLCALQPYLNNNRIHKLERAMRAAKMAGFATSLIGR